MAEKELRVSVITPIYNESENIDDLCKALDDYAQGLSYAVECIFVNDGSTDNSLDKLKQYTFKNVFSKVVNLSKNYGSHAAIRAGMTVSSAPYTMLFSGDLQEPAELIGMMYSKASLGHDIVCVVRKQDRVSVFSKKYAKLIKKHAVSSFPESGFNNFMLSRKVLELIKENPEANSSVFLQVLNLGFSPELIECRYNERQKGQSKWTLSKKLKLFVDSFVAFSYMPIRFITGLGFVLSFAGFIYALSIIIVKLFNLFDLQAGFPTIIAVILMGFGITNISLGIIAEYLWRTLDASRNRPVFVIREVVEKPPLSKPGGSEDR